MNLVIILCHSQPSIRKSNSKNNGNYSVCVADIPDYYGKTLVQNSEILAPIFTNFGFGEVSRGSSLPFIRDTHMFASAVILENQIQLSSVWAPCKDASFVFVPG